MSTLPNPDTDPAGFLGGVAALMRANRGARGLHALLRARDVPRGRRDRGGLAMTCDHPTHDSALCDACAWDMARDADDQRRYDVERDGR